MLEFIFDEVTMSEDAGKSWLTRTQLLTDRERKACRFVFHSMAGSLTSCLRCQVVLHVLRRLGFDVLSCQRPYARLRLALHETGSPFAAATPKLEIQMGCASSQHTMYHESTCFRFLVEQWRRSGGASAPAGSSATQLQISDWCAHVEFLLQEFRTQQVVASSAANSGDRQWVLRAMGTHLAAICAQLDTKRDDKSASGSEAILSRRVARFIVGDALSAADISLFVLLVALAREESLLFTVFPFLKEYFFPLARSEPFSSCQEVLQALPKS